MVKLSMLTQNARGVQSKKTFEKLLKEFSRWRGAAGLHALCVQEHNLHPSKENELKRMAKSKHVTLIISFAPDNGTGQHPGGVLLFLDDKSLDYKSTKYVQNGLVVVEIEWGGEPSLHARSE